MSKKLARVYRPVQSSEKSLDLNRRPTTLQFKSNEIQTLSIVYNLELVHEYPCIAAI
jgi:hypothetical protein